MQEPAIASPSPVEAPLATHERILKNEACPRWLKELHTFLPVKAQFVLYGNIRDIFPLPLVDGGLGLRHMHDYLTDFFYSLGFDAILLSDPINGVCLRPPSHLDPKRHPKGQQDYTKTSMEALNVILAQQLGDASLTFKHDSKRNRVGLGARFTDTVRVAEALIRQPNLAVAVLFDFMMGHLSKDDAGAVDSFVRSLILSYEAGPSPRLSPLMFTPIIWLCDRENELPAWLSLDNPRIRSISVGRPDPGMRRCVCEAILMRDPVFKELLPENRKAIITNYVMQTDGLMLNDIQAINFFRQASKLGPANIGAAALRYKLGITEDPWKKLLENESVKSFVEKKREWMVKRVKGQTAAVERVCLLLRKALVGVSGAQAGGMNGRPKGVLFLVGPTGTGKTELVKAVTEAVFGNERSYIRFDMAEFGAEHAGQRLMGAPPGYVGYESGGELVQAVQQKPCSVILFDEIEKAHTKLWDKFLAILDDGQLTSGRGERVYFSETIIAFTSNLGMDEMRKAEEAARLTGGDGLPSLEDLEQKVFEAIDTFFREKLKRPELKARFGDSFVLFDYIRPSVAREIFANQVALVFKRYEEVTGMSFILEGGPEIAGSAWRRLADRCCKDTTQGGRGIGNAVDKFLNGPLVVWLVENSHRFKPRQDIPEPLKTVTIRDFVERADGSIDLELDVP